MHKGHVGTVEHVLHRPRPMAVPQPLGVGAAQPARDQAFGRDGLRRRRGAGFGVDPDIVAQPAHRQGLGGQTLAARLRIERRMAVDAVDVETPSVERTFEAAVVADMAQRKRYAPVRTAIDQGADRPRSILEQHDRLSGQDHAHRSAPQGLDRGQRRPNLREPLEHPDDLPIRATTRSNRGAPSDPAAPQAPERSLRLYGRRQGPDR